MWVETIHCYVGVQLLRCGCYQCSHWCKTSESLNLEFGMDIQASKFQIECTCPSGKWIVKITCPNVPLTCLKYTKPMQLMWESEIRSRSSDKACRYSTCPTVIFTLLRRSDKWNFEPWYFMSVPHYKVQSNPVISRAVNSRKPVSRACTLDPKF